MSNSSVVKYWGIVPAAGIGSRMQSATPKQYLQLHNKTVLEHTLCRLAQLTSLEAIVVAISDNDPYWPKLNLDIAKPIQTVKGGAERCHSVLNALESLADKAESSDWVLVHDAARPCVRTDDLVKLVTDVQNHSTGGLLGIPVRDTMKRTDDQSNVTETVERNNLWHALTPQMFRFGQLQQAMNDAINKQFLVTDEASAMEFAGYTPVMIEGHADNIKITRPEDLELASFYLQHQHEQGVVGLSNGLDDGG